ncbi:Alpha/Beta hydrolase protein [Xylariales sp. PMI_506]|nr:Alpha/Beta hydrolase protein [Xylariales sp. PMI_506]
MVEFVDINGARLAYRIAGPDDAPLLITLHGGRGMGSHDSDFRAFSPLAPDYRVLSFDYRGHGQSSQTKPYTFAQIVDDIEAVRAHFAGPETKVIICGGSFGGFLAQQYAITYPHRVAHLILRGTAPSYHQEDDAIKALEKRLDRVPTFSMKMLKEKVFGFFENDLEFRLVYHAMSPMYIDDGSYNADAALANNLKTVFNAEAHNDLYSEKEKYFDYREDLHKITAKTLIIFGDQDWICAPEHSRLIGSKIPHSELAEYKGANHGVHWERHAEVIQRIRDFLAAQS